MMTFTFRVNNLQYREVQNAYLVDLKADQLYVIPRRLDPARARMQRDDVRQTFLHDTLTRLRNDALVARLRAHPGQAVVLPPAQDWVSGIRTVTFAILVQAGASRPRSWPWSSRCLRCCRTGRPSMAISCW